MEQNAPHTARTPPRIDWIDIAKGISIALVTWHHVVQYGSGWGLSLDLFESLNYYLAPIRMPLFFAVAGIFSLKAVSKSWPQLLHSRVALMFWLLLCWTTIRWLVLHFLATNPVNPAEGNDPSVLFLALLGPDNGIWFLWTLGVFFIATKALHGLPRLAVLIPLILISIWAGGYLFDQSFLKAHPYIQNLAHRNSIRYFLFFWCASQYPQVLLRAARIDAKWLIALLPATAALVLLAERIPVPMLAGTARLLGTCSGVTSLFIVARIVRATPLGAVLRYLGQNTLAIYVAQIPVLCLLLGLFPTAIMDWPEMAELAISLLLFAAVLGLTLALRGLAERLGAGWLYTLPTISLFRDGRKISADRSPEPERSNP